MDVNCSSELQDVLNEAYAMAKHFRHEFFTPEHVLTIMLQKTKAINLMNYCMADKDRLLANLADYMANNIPVAPQSVGPISPQETVTFSEIMNNALSHCKSCEKSVIDIFDVIVCMIEAEKSYCSYFLKKEGLTKILLLEIISCYSILEEVINMGSGKATKNTNEHAKETSGKNEKQKNIYDIYCTELVSLAKKGELDNVVERENEIERTIQILLRRKKNNPIYVGEQGVGKTVLVNALAMKIASGDVPDFLKDFTIYSLDLTSLFAGSSYRGVIETRIKKITEELIKKENAILFIDEFHNTISQGYGSDLSVVNALNPILTNGKLRCIATTTYSEYSKKIEKSGTIANCFQKIDVAEPSREEAFNMLKSLKQKYEQYHNVKFSDECLHLIIDLAVQYISDRNLPDKAIDVLDEVGAHCKIYNKPNSSSVCVTESGIHIGEEKFSEDENTICVTEDDVKKVCAKIARVPLETVKIDEKEKLKNLQANVSREIFGQDNAVKIVSMAVKKARAGFSNGEKPKGCFLFVGPTGVGKTELARTLSKILNMPLLRYDMSEYQEEHAVSRFFGSPPGYVGYEEGGELTESVRKNPSAIILFDEIEKAHSKIYNAFLQIMDYGVLTDGQGRKSNFKNCIIIMTSNAGARDIEKGSIGFGTSDVIGEDASVHWELSPVKEAVEKTFSPEFRNRLDAIVPFANLSKEIIVDITKKEINKLNVLLAKKQVSLSASERAIDYLSKKGYSHEFGARNISRIVDAEVVAPLTDEVLFGKLSSGGTVMVDFENDALSFVYE